MPPRHGRAILLAPLRTFLRLFAAAQLLFWAAWWVGYAWLPETALRGRTGAALLPLERLPAGPRMLAVLGWNGLVAASFVAGANLIRVRRLPLGFVPPLAYWTLYGLLLGTGSFAGGPDGRLAPSLALVLGRAGFLELTAYLLVAAATAGWARWQQDGWLAGPLRPLAPPPLRATERALLVLAGALLVAAALREVGQWRAATGCC